jgi:hypothetical protein
MKMVQIPREAQITNGNSSEVARSSNRRETSSDPFEHRAGHGQELRIARMEDEAYWADVEHNEAVATAEVEGRPNEQSNEN